MYEKKFLPNAVYFEVKVVRSRTFIIKERKMKKIDQSKVIPLYQSKIRIFD